MGRRVNVGAPALPPALCPHARLPPAPACSACCCPCRAEPGRGSHRCPCQAHTRSRSQPSPRCTAVTRRRQLAVGAGFPPQPFPCFRLSSHQPVPGPQPPSLPYEGPHPDPQSGSLALPLPQILPFLPSPRSSSPSRTLHHCVQRDSARGRGRGCGLGCGRSGLEGSPGSGCPGSPGDRDHT